MREKYMLVKKQWEKMKKFMIFIMKRLWNIFQKKRRIWGKILAVFNPWGSIGIDIFKFYLFFTFFLSKFLFFGLFNVINIFYCLAIFYSISQLLFEFFVCVSGLGSLGVKMGSNNIFRVNHFLKQEMNQILSCLQLVIVERRK